MIILGLTGSIGMGKSTTASMMKILGIAVHDSDATVQELLKPESKARPAIASHFPYFEFPQIYIKKTYEINRRELGKLVFNNDELRERLESILHPLVKKSQNEFIRQSRAKGLDMICLDIPLLFETGADKDVDYTINVSAPYFIQRARVLSRPNMTEEKFKAILSRQMPDHEKCKRADFVIKTGLGCAHTMKSLKQVIYKIREDSRIYNNNESPNKENIADNHNQSCRQTT